MRWGKKAIIGFIIWVLCYFLGIFIIWKIREPFFTPQPDDCDVPYVIGLILWTILSEVSWVVLLWRFDKSEKKYKGGEK